MCLLVSCFVPISEQEMIEIVCCTDTVCACVCCYLLSKKLKIICSSQRAALELDLKVHMVKASKGG